MLHNLVDSLAHQERVVGKATRIGRAGADAAQDCAKATAAVKKSTVDRVGARSQPAAGRCRANCSSAAFVFVC